MAEDLVVKIQECAAHEAAVNCVSFGRKSGGVFASGGDDKKVHVWTVGKSEPVMCLSGNPSGVEALQFDPQEEVVAAGLASGGLRLWDLVAGKMVRALPGHTSNVRCLDFHPYGEFIASGSLDTTLKVWDIRQKSCIQTYKGHSDAVACARFSPDGRWIVSAADDSTVKLWDVTGGKLLNEFKAHTGPVTGVEFHPNEFLLATGSADRTVKFLDLESFQMVSSNGPDTSRIRCLAFHSEGTALYSATQDTLRCHGWEPGIVLDSMNVGWGRVGDMVCPSASKMLAASLAGNDVVLWSVSLDSINTDRTRVVERKHARPSTSSAASETGARLPAAAAAYSAQAPATATASRPDAKPKASQAQDVMPAMQKLRLDPETFMAKNSADSSPGDVLGSVAAEHASTITALSKRLKHVKIVRSSWTHGQRRALEQLSELGDAGAMADVLNVLALKPSLWNMELACAAVPSLETLLRSKQESHVLSGCSVAQLLAKSLGSVVLTNLQAPPPRGGADFSREERYERCQTLGSFFRMAQRIISERSGDTAKVASALRKLALALDGF